MKKITWCIKSFWLEISLSFHFLLVYTHTHKHFKLKEKLKKDMLMVYASLHVCAYVYVHVTHIRVSKYVKQTSAYLKREVDSNTTISGDLNTLLSILEWISRQKIKRKHLNLNNRTDPTDIFTTFYSTAKSSHFLKCTQNIPLGRSYVKAQSNFQHSKELRPQWSKTRNR